MIVKCSLLGGELTCGCNVKGLVSDNFKDSVSRIKWLKTFTPKQWESNLVLYEKQNRNKKKLQSQDRIKGYLRTFSVVNRLMINFDLNAYSHYNIDEIKCVWQVQ